MYLKQIITQGFKSFADKTVLEFHPGITGIVGPNGSGKSNVVDAVRWVLGEQSIKSLRGDDKMTDVIFSGSKSRKAMNVASVTLVFDNSDHYLKVPYEEVSITRRVYKDGSNEYLLNHERCRLKDISEVLLDTGVAKESFNIISQGKIEEILSSKPEDRRVIFEEAAGVLKYKKRKEEALRKLDRTNDNMKRVEDIIEELKVQVEPLKEQKEKACIYKEKSEQLQKVEISVITHDIHNLHTEYEETKQQLEKRNQEVLAMDTTNRQNEAMIAKYKENVAKIEQQMETVRQEYMDLSTLATKLDGERKLITERKKYEVDDQALLSQSLLLKEEAEKLNTDIRVLESQIQLEKENYQTILKESHKLKNEEEEVQNQKRKKNQAIHVSVRFYEQCLQKIRDLEEAIDTSSSLPLAVRSVLNEPRLSGIHDAVSKLIEIDEKYTDAFSVALGASSNYIVVEKEKDAKEAIAYLKQKHLGRATFYPLDVIQKKELDPDLFYRLKKEEGFLGIASDLASFAPIYANIVKNLLGLTVVVDTLDHASIIAKKFHHRLRIVTLQGELLQPGGSLTGGYLKPTHNPLKDKFDLEQEKTKLHLLESEKQTLEEEMNEIDNQLAALSDQVYLKEKEKMTKSFWIDEQEKKLEQLKLRKQDRTDELKRTEQVLNRTLSEEEERTIQAYYDTLEKKESIEVKLNYLKQEHLKAKSSLEDLEFASKRENSLFQSKNKEIQSLEISLNRMDVKLDTLLSSLTETYGMTYEHASYHYPLEMEIDSARALISKLKTDMKELGEVNLGSIEEYERVHTRYDFLLSQKEDLEEAIKQLLEIIDEMDTVMKEEFLHTFEIVNANFKTTFQELFRGGDATLKLTDKDNILETGIEIIASPPGKKLTTIGLLSGGEKTFTAISLLFAILKSRPVPFCILDEVEAALDEANVDSFGKYVQKLKEKTQFILITHKKKTMEYADVLYGITMQESGVSKLVSVKLEEMKNG